MMNTEAPDTRVNRRYDVIAIAVLIGLIAITNAVRFRYDDWLSEFDIFGFFLPWYGEVGDRVRHLDVPGWTSAFSAGSPLAGDPSGGWMYLPVMAAFALFEVATAFKVLVLLHCLIGGVSLYAFARRIGLSPVAALFAATTFALGPMLYGATSYTTVAVQVMTFVAVGLLALENALRADRLSGRIGWGTLAGIAVSQMFTAWPGQGVLLGCMYLAGWLAYRLIIAPHPEAGDWRSHLNRSLLIGVVTGIVALGFGAAGILPRLAYNGESNVPGGDYTGLIGADYASYRWTIEIILNLQLQDLPLVRTHGHSAVVLLLGVLALLTAGRRFGMPFFAAAIFLFVDLALIDSLTRPFFYLLPQFENIHGHRPTGSLLVLPLAIAMMAGAGIEVLQQHRASIRALLVRLVPFGVLLYVFWVIERNGFTTQRVQILLGLGTTVLLVLPVVMGPVLRRIPPHSAITAVTIALFALSLVYPTSMDLYDTISQPDDGPDWDELLGTNPALQDVLDTALARDDPGGAGEFLQTQQQLVAPFRYAPFFGSDLVSYEGGYSTSRRTDQALLVTLANARSQRLGLEQITGYNPVHLDDFIEYIDVMNGGQQDYHWADVMLPAVSGSPLLDMLNVRYVLVPRSLSPQPPIAATAKVVFQNDSVTVYENPDAYQRAWIVHDVRQDLDGEELKLIDSGQVDGRNTAFVHGDLPPVTPADAAAPADLATVTDRNEASMTVRTRTSSDGFLVLSEIYAKGWTATVDGESVDVQRTNHALRGVALPAGEHEVILRYEPRSLTIGILSTGLTTVAIIGIWGWALWDRRRRSR